MTIFATDRDAARDAYATQGWVHLPKAVTPEFLAHARDRIKALRRTEVELVGGNRRNKEQFRFDFDDPSAAQAEIFSFAADLAGVPAQSLTLSERHVNAYHADAVANPVPHKDRRASQITIGLSIDVSPGSHLVLYPGTDRSENRYDSAAELYASLVEQQRPEQILSGAPEVVIYDRPGDVLVFPGSTTWHCRRQAASTVNLFFKLNDFGDDPLGEDARHTLVATADMAGM